MGVNDIIFCRKCGKQLLPDAGFCNKCGTKVVKESVAPPLVSEMPVQQSKPPSVPPPEIVRPTVVTPPPTPPPVQKKPLEYVPPIITPSPITQTKKSNSLVWVAGILVILFIAAISGGTFFYLKNKNLQKEVTNLTDQVDRLNQLLSDCTTEAGGTTKDIVSTVLSNDTVALKGLLDSGVDPNTKDTAGTPVLILASVNGQKECVSLLLDKGANVNAQAEDGETALMVTSAKGYKDIVVILLNKGADVNVKDNESSTALEYARVNNHDDIANILRSKTK